MNLEAYIAKRGSLSALASSLDVSPSTVLRWVQGRVPAERVRSVSEATGIPAHTLRPDLFDAPRIVPAPPPKTWDREQ